MNNLRADNAGGEGLVPLALALRLPAVSRQVVVALLLICSFAGGIAVAALVGSLSRPTVAVERPAAFGQPIDLSPVSRQRLDSTQPPQPIAAETPNMGVIAAEPGRIDLVTAEASSPPTFLRIPSIGLEAPIEAVGYDSTQDEMEVPASASVVGWYEFGPTPGERGSSVLAAHVDWGGRPGAFFDLTNIPAGARIEVSFADGSLRVFTAISRHTYDKQSLPTNQLFDRDVQPVLTLITCGGSFNASLGSYQDNVVVQAIEVRPTTSQLPS